MAEDVFDPGTPSAEGASPSTPSEGAELGSQVPSSELGAQGQAPQTPTLEDLIKRVEIAEKRISDAQADVHTTRAQKAALESQLAAARSAPLRQGYNAQQQPTFDPFGGYAPQFDPQAGQQSAETNMVLGLAAEGVIRANMADAQEELGFKFSGEEKQAIRDHLNAIGSVDAVAGAKLILHSKIIERARDAAKAETLESVQKSHKAVVQTPSGQTGQPKREYSQGPRGYDEIQRDLEAQGKL